MSLLVKEQLYLIHGYIRRVDDTLIGWIIPDSVVKLCSQYFLASIEYGYCLKSGIWPRMENCFVLEPIFDVIGSKCTSGYLSIYAVFAGHGGRQCAEFCSLNLTKILTKYLLTQENINNAFELCIEELDKKAIECALDASGSTACIILIDNKTYDLWCCNIGDSRAIIMNKDYTQVKQLSIEHKPDKPIEKKRIEDANGWVTFGRICGIFDVSRSLGDKDFKYEIENLIISKPDITHHKLKWTQDKFIILACHPLFDVFTNKQCMEWVANKNKNMQVSTQQLTEQLVDDAIHVRHEKGDVAAIIIQFLQQMVKFDI
eukprot:101104_1